METLKVQSSEEYLKKMEEYHPETLDVSGYICPKPLWDTRNKLRQMQIGQVLLVIATDQATKEDISRWTSRTKNPLLATYEEGEKLYYLIRKETNV